MNTIHFKYWTEADYIALQKVSTFRELGEIAHEILHRFPDKVDMISGPITTGGVGSVKGNMAVFEGVIELLMLETSLPVFSQMPFEEKIAELATVWYGMPENQGKYCMPILEDFYERIFGSGKVSKLHLIHGWGSSHGARWEHENCGRWKIEKNYLSDELSRRVIESRQLLVA